MKTSVRRAASRFIVLASLVLLPLSCEVASLYQVWDDMVYYGLSISPSSMTLDKDQVATLTVTGGKEPYVFELLYGTGTLTPLDGHAEYSASSSTDALVRVTDARGDVCEAEILVQESITQLVLSPSSAALQTGGTITFTAGGGLSPYAFTLESGGGTVVSSGAATADYTAPGYATTAVVLLEDASGQAFQAIVTVADNPPLEISPTSLTLEEGTNFTFSASGGDGTYAWSADWGSVSPAAGTSTDYTAPAYAVSTTDTVTLTDGTAATASVAVSVAYATADPLAVSPVSVNVPYGGTCQFTASGGEAPYVFSMDPLATFGGTVTAAGLYTAPSVRQGVERVIATDNRGITAAATVKVKK